MTTGNGRCARKCLAAAVALVYTTTQVVFSHSAEAEFWTARRAASRKLNGNGTVSDPARSGASVPTDALVLAQLPGGVRFDVHSPAPVYVSPVPAREHLVGGKVPVFSSDLPRWLGDVVTPYGNIRDVHLSKRPGAPLVIHVQDLHDSAEAQRNIAGLLEALQDERGVSLVGLEGAQGAFATEAFRAFPDAEITKAVASYFMDEGYLGGPEFAGITAKRVPLLWGVEDMNGFNANVAAVRESAANRPSLELFLREARTLLDEIKTRQLSPALREFDRHFTAYQSRKMPLGAYVRYLLKSSPSGAARAPNLVLLRDALTWEDSLDFPRIERERASLLERLVGVMSKHQLNLLVDKSALYRLGRISYGDYYRFFRTLCDENRIALSEYQQLHAYVRYVLLAERINRNDLLNELSALELNVQNSLTFTDRERRVVNTARYLGQLERLVRHSYTPADWGYHLLHEEEIRNVGRTVRELAKEEGLPETLSPPTSEMVKPFENFCLQALGRNGAMVSRLLEKMTAEKRPAALLVAGGFHTDGMMQLLRQKDVSYVVVTPKIIGDLPASQRSLDFLARDPAPLEKLFAGDTVNIPTQRIVSTENGNNSFVQYAVSLYAALVLGLSALSTGEKVQLSQPLPGVVAAQAEPANAGSAEVTVRSDTGENVLRVRFAVGQVPEGSVVAAVQGYGDFVVEGIHPFNWAQKIRSGLLGLWSGLGSMGRTLLGSLVALKKPLAGAAGVLLPMAAQAGTFESLSLASLIPAGVWPLFLSGLVTGLVLFALNKKFLQPAVKNVSERLARIRQQAPAFYFSMIGVGKALLFPATGLLIVPDFLMSFGFSPALSWATGFLWGVPLLWFSGPLARALEKGTPMISIVRSLRRDLLLKRKTDDWTATRLSAAFGVFGIFAVGLWLPYIGSFWTALVLASGFSIFRDLGFRAKGRADPFIPATLGYLGLVWVLLTTPARLIHFVGGDGDGFGPLNAALGKELVGTAPGTRNESVSFSKRSLFWERRQKLADLAWSARKIRIIKGVGGDEYLSVDVGSSDEVESALGQIVDQLNQHGLVNNRPKEAFFYISSKLNLFEIQKLKDWGPSIALIQHEGGFKLSVDRSVSPNKTSEEWILDIASRVGLQEKRGAIKEIELVKGDGGAVFTTSMGIVSALEVASILAEIEGVSIEKWLRRDGKVRWSKIPEFVLWGYRFSSDALNAAKKGKFEHSSEEINEGGTRKKNRVYLATKKDLDQLKKSSVVDRKAIIKTRKDKWRGILQFARAGVDPLSKMLSPITFHVRLSRENPSYLYRFDISRYLSSSEMFFTSRGFHHLQGNQYAFGDEVIGYIAEILRTELSNKGFMSRSGPDTYYFAAREKLKPEDIEEISDEINLKLKSIWPKEDWSVFLAAYEVARNDNNSSIDRWPLSGLSQVNQLGDAVKFQGELVRFGDLIKKRAMTYSEYQSAGNNSFLVSFSENKSKIGKLMGRIVTKERAQGKMSVEKIQSSSVEKTLPLGNGITPNSEVEVPEKTFQRTNTSYGGQWLKDTFIMPVYELPLLPFLGTTLTLGMGLFGVPLAGLFFGSGLMALFHGIPQRGPPVGQGKRQSFKQFYIRLIFAFVINTLALTLSGVPVDVLLSTMPIDFNSVVSSMDFTRLTSYGYLMHVAYNAVVSQEYRLSLGGRGKSNQGAPAPRALDPQLVVESNRFRAKKAELLAELESLGGDRLKTFQEISSFRFLPPSRNADDQIQKNMDRILRQLAIGGVTGKSKHVADTVLFEAVFYDKLAALQELINKKEQTVMYHLEASDREMVRTAALIFVPMASRLGWNAMADHIADLTFELLDPFGHDRIKVDLLEGMGFSSLSEMDQHARLLQAQMETAAKALLGPHVDVRVRRKRLYSIAAKMKNKPDRYRSARDVNDAFNAVVVFNKRRSESWASSQGLLYNQIYAVLQAEPIQGYKDGRDPKDSYEPKGREDTHVLFKTAHGFVEVQFKSWDVFKEYKSKGQVTDRWKKPAHWIYKTMSILKGLYKVENLRLESDAFELVGDVGKNLEGVVRGLLPFEYPAIINALGNEYRVVKILAGSKVLDLVARPETGIPLEDVTKIKVTRTSDRRMVGQETPIQSADVFSLNGNGAYNGTSLPSGQFTLRARLALLSDSVRNAGLVKANEELRDLLPAGMRSSGILESLINLLTLSTPRADHRREMFLSTARSIAARNGLVSLDELYAAWGTGLMSSEDLGRNIYEEGRRILSEHRLGLDDPNVVAAFQSMIAESEEIDGMLVALPPILGKCSEMLYSNHPDQRTSKELVKLVLGISLGLISMDTVISNYPSVSVEAKKVGHKHEFTIRGSDRVGFILRIVQLLNEFDATVDRIIAPPANVSANETAIKVSVHVKPENLEKLRSALGTIPAAESGPMPNAKAHSYRLKILHEQGMKPLENALEVLENFEANITEVPSAGEGERFIDFRLDPRQVAALEKALSNRATELGDEVFFFVEDLPNPGNSSVSVGAMMAFPLVDPSGLSLSLLMVGGLVLGAGYPPARRWIENHFKFPRINSFLWPLLVGVSLFFLMQGIAFAAGGEVVSRGDWFFPAVESWGAGSLSAVVLALAGIKSVSEIRLNGSPNGANSIGVGTAMWYVPDPIGGVPYEIYALKTPGDSDELLNERIVRQINRVHRAFDIQEEAGTFSSVEQKNGLIYAIESRIHAEKINAQAAVAEVMDEAIATYSDTAVVDELIKLRKGLLLWLGDTHSLAALGERGLEERLLKERQDLRSVKDQAWRMVAGDLPGWDKPSTTWIGEDDATQILKMKKAVFDDVFSSAEKSLLKYKISARGALGRQYRDLAESIGDMEKVNDLDLAQIIQGARDSLRVITTVIALLGHPALTLDSQTREKRRLTAALEEVSPTTHWGRKFRAFIEERTPRMINVNRRAASAVLLLKNEFINLNGFLNDRAAVSEIENVSEKIIAQLEREDLVVKHELRGQPVVVVTRNVLTPADMAEIRESGVNPVAYLAETGNSGMHAPIVAASGGTLYVTSVGDTIRQIENGDPVVVFPDGQVTVRPSRKTLNSVNEKIGQMAALSRLYEKERSNFVEVPVASSPDAVDDISRGESVGLFRTEWFYMDPLRSPSETDGTLSATFENDLVRSLVEAARKTNGEFYVRVLDYQVGEDKPLRGLPASSQTGAQYLLGDGKNFAIQEIRAILRAYLLAPNIRLFFPMVTNAQEASDLKKLVMEVKQDPQFFNERNKLDSLPVGFMVENPSVVEEIYELLDLSDFVNIGTKDLTRFTFAGSETTDQQLNAYLNQLKPEVISQIVKVLKAAKQKRDKAKDEKKFPVTACGVLAGKDIFLPLAVVLNRLYGVKLSVAPANVARVKYFIRKIVNHPKDLEKIKAALYEGDFEKLNEVSLKILAKVENETLKSPEYKTHLLSGVMMVGFGLLGVLLVLSLGYIPLDSFAGPGWGGASLLTLAGSLRVSKSRLDEASDERHGKLVNKAIQETRTPISEADIIYSKNLTININNVVVEKLGGGHNVYIQENKSEELDVVVSEKAIDQWNLSDKSRGMSGFETSRRYLGYARTQLHTAVLAAMARHVLNVIGAHDIEPAISNVGLTEESVLGLFENDLANGESIRELQNQRFVSLMFTSWSMKFNNVLPIGKPGQLETAISGMTIDSERQNPYRLRALAVFGLGNRDFNSVAGKPIWDIAKTDFQSDPEMYRPNELAVALDKFAKENNVTAEDMKGKLTVTLLSRIDAWMGSLTRDKLNEMWGALALLVGLNGSMSEGRIPSNGFGGKLRNVRRHLQNLDLRFLTNLSFTVGNEMNNGTDNVQNGLAEFNRVAQHSLALRDPHQALTEAFSKGEDILVYLSPNIANGNKNGLTPAEKTQIELISLLSKRLADEEDGEAEEWKTKNKRVIFALVGLSESAANLELSQRGFVSSATRAGADVFGLNRGADYSKFKLEFARFTPPAKSNVISALDNFKRLKIEQVSLFALDVEGVTVDYTGVENNIVSFILALAGGLMTQVAPGIGESLIRTRAVKLSA